MAVPFTRIVTARFAVEIPSLVRSPRRYWTRLSPWARVWSAAARQVAPAAQLGDDVPILTSLRTGAVDLSANSQGAISSAVPEYAAFGLPFLFPNLQAAWKVLDGPVGAELAKHTEAKGMVVLGYWDNGIRHVSNKVRPINSPADLKGLKVRTPPDPVTIDIMQALGADAQQIKFSELYVALQQGVVDGQENPLVVISNFKMFEVQKYCSVTNHMWDGFWFLANAKNWNSLPKEVQTVIQKHFNDYAIKEREDIANLNATLQKELVEKGLQVVDANPASFRTKLGSAGFYKEWKEKYGAEPWALLEKYAGSIS